MWPRMWAHWRHLVNMIELVLPSAHPSPQPKQQIDRFSQFCTADARIPTLYKWTTVFPKLAPSHGESGPHLTHDSLGHSQLTIQTASQSVQLLSHRLPQSVPILYNGMTLSPSKLPISMRRSGPPYNTWFPGPIWDLNPNGFLIRSAIFAGLTSVTDRQTVRPSYSVGNNIPHLRT